MTARTIAITILGALLAVGAIWWARSSTPRAAEERPEAPPVGAPGLAARGSPPVIPAVAPTTQRARKDESAARPAVAAPELAESEARWLRRINATRDRSSLHRVLADLASETPDATLLVVQRVFGQVVDLKRRLSILEFFGKDSAHGQVHPHAVTILDLGVQDPLLRVESRALKLMGRLAYREFKDTGRVYDSWQRAQSGKNAADVMRAEAMTLIARLREFEGKDLEGALRKRRLLRGPLEHAWAVREAGGRELAHAWWTDPRQTESVRALGMSWISTFRPDATYLRDHVRPVLRNPRGHGDAVIRGAIQLLAAHGKPWAFEDLIAAYEVVPRKGLWWTLTRALVSLGDARAIPHMIAVIVADGTYDSVYGIGHVGLKSLTGVTYAEDHDGAWWQAWWTRHRARFPDAAALTLPRLILQAR